MIVLYKDRPALAAHADGATHTFLTMLDASAETYDEVPFDAVLTEQPVPTHGFTDLRTDHSVSVIEIPDFLEDYPYGDPVFTIWCRAHGITYYARRAESFAPSAALAQAIAEGNVRVIMESLS